LGLNEALCGKFEHHFVTAAYVFIDIQNGTLKYAGAGHPPLFLWGLGGVRSIEENGLFLGKFSFATYTSTELTLMPGDRILLYTDGIPETTSPAGVEFGSDAFRQFLENEEPATSAAQFADQLLEELSRWSARGPGDELDDDMTIVAIHVGSH